MEDTADICLPKDSPLISSWDMESEIFDQVEIIQVASCNICQDILPYTGGANHTCSENSDQEDEGFSENENYLNRFDAFLEEFGDHDRVRFVTECVDGCGCMHSIVMLDRQMDVEPGELDIDHQMQIEDDDLQELMDALEERE